MARAKVKCPDTEMGLFLVVFKANSQNGLLTDEMRGIEESEEIY